jgi:hypothetical protein
VAFCKGKYYLIIIVDMEILITRACSMSTIISCVNNILPRVSLVHGSTPSYSMSVIISYVNNNLPRVSLVHGSTPSYMRTNCPRADERITSATH